MDITNPCEHLWTNDPMFEDETVVMLTNDNPERTLGEEMRQVCSKCGAVRYVAK